MRGRIAWSLALLLGGAAVARADVSASAFVPLSGGARAFALSGACVALTDDASATFVNPARLAFQRGAGFTAGYARLVEGIPSDRGEAAVAIPIGPSTAAPFQKEGVHLLVVGLGVDYLRLELSQGSIYSETSGTLAIGFSPTNVAAFGAGLRGLRASSDVDGLDANGVALDLGFSLAVLPELELAVAARNLAGSVSYEGAESESPGHTTSFGLAFTRNRRLGAEADFTTEFEGGSSAAVGVEVKPGAGIALRGGARQWIEPESRLVPSAGLGVRFSGYSLDYGVSFDGDDHLGVVQRVSLGFSP